MTKPLTREQLSQQIKAAHEANQRVLKETEHRSEELKRLARESVQVVERAVRTLRYGQ